MARARSIKPGFFSNEDLIELPFEYRLLFAGLWTLADREGRLEDRPKKIKLNVFPGDNVDCDAGLSALEKAGFVQRYESYGERYVQIIKFAEHQSPHQREVPSQIPAPPGSSDRFNHAPVTKEQRLRILARDGHRCTNCEEIERLHVDHIVPICKGGTSEDANLQTLCWLCNGRKSNKVVPKHDLGSAEQQPGLLPAALTPSSLTPDSGLLTPDSPSSGVVSIPPQRKMTPEGEMACALVNLGVRVTSIHPTLVAWVRDGITVPQATEAVRLARQTKLDPEPIPANYLDKILREPQRGPPARRLSRYEQSRQILGETEDVGFG